MAKIYHYYQTNEPNILGGFMTYDTLESALGQLGKRFCGGVVDEIRVVTKVNSEWWHGHYNGFLCETLSEGIIYKA